MRVVTDETAMVTRAIIVGWQTRELTAVSMWQLHREGEASVDRWWMQVQLGGWHNVAKGAEAVAAAGAEELVG